MKTRATIFSVFEECLIPSLHKPPPMFIPMSGAICAWSGPLNSFYSFLKGGIQKFRDGVEEYGVLVKFSDKTNLMLEEVDGIYKMTTTREYLNFWWLRFTFWVYSFTFGRWLFNALHRSAIQVLLWKKRPESSKLK